MENIFTSQEFEKSKLPTNFYKSLSSLLFDLGIDGNDVVEDFISHYISHAYEQTKTKSSVYLTTGFSRHIVKKYLEEKETHSKSNSKFMHQTVLLAELHKLSKKYDDGLIPIYGKFGSYTSTFNRVKPQDNIITSKTVLDILISSGKVKKKGEYIQFISSLGRKGLRDKASIINTLAISMARMSNTIQHNYHAKTNEETLFQASYFSTLIKPENRRKLTDKLRELTRKHFREYQALIDSYEETDLTPKEVEDLNNEIGISTFIFDNEKEV
ncbi:MAG TPA: hypothetical protein PK055_11530 [Gammaproteobacteria bacterium]|nr:hypothetical protein [Gammaproteobacteria bacterium]HPQ88279.1 hypothetical protein [Gammaproteobacteria bacterium]